MTPVEKLMVGAWVVAFLTTAVVMGGLALDAAGVVGL